MRTCHPEVASNTRMQRPSIPLHLRHVTCLCSSAFALSRKQRKARQGKARQGKQTNAQQKVSRNSPQHTSPPRCKVKQTCKSVNDGVGFWLATGAHAGEWMHAAHPVCILCHLHQATILFLHIVFFASWPPYSALSQVSMRVMHGCLQALMQVWMTSTLGVQWT